MLDLAGERQTGQEDSTGSSDVSGRLPGGTGHAVAALFLPVSNKRFSLGGSSVSGVVWLIGYKVGILYKCSYGSSLLFVLQLKSQHNVYGSSISESRHSLAHILEPFLIFFFFLLSIRLEQETHVSSVLGLRDV